MTPELKAQLSDERLRASIDGVDRMNVVTLQPSTIQPSRVVYTVGVIVRAAANASGEWTNGQNNRAVTMMCSTGGWKIGAVEVAAVPQPATATPAI